MAIIAEAAKKFINRLPERGFCFIANRHSSMIVPRWGGAWMQGGSLAETATQAILSRCAVAALLLARLGTG